MELLLSLITSGSIKYISILVLALGLGVTLFRMHLNSLDAERQKALNENTIRQLEQIVKEKEQQFQQMKEIYDAKVGTMNKLIEERKEIEDKLKAAELEIEKIVNTGKDKPASSVLKDLFKSLGGPTQ